MYDVLTLGIMVADVMVKPVNHLPAPGHLELVNSVELFSGGNAMTAAINLSKLGLKSTVIGKIGTDPFGDFLLNCLEKNSVSSAGVARTDKAQTSSSICAVDESGERTFLHCRGANAILELADIDYDLVKDSKIVFVTGTFLLGDFDGQQTVDFLKECKNLGKTTVLDVCWNDTGDKDWLLHDALPYLDIFMPSIDEAKMIAGKDDLEEISDIFFAHGAKKIVIKCGSDGCYIRESQDQPGKMIPAILCKTVADTTGAGDSFCSGFLAAYAKGFPFEKCADFGNAVGACCVTQMGATSGTRSFEETQIIAETKKN